MHSRPPLRNRSAHPGGQCPYIPEEWCLAFIVRAIHHRRRGVNPPPPCTPPPPPETKVTIVGSNEIYGWEYLIGPFFGFWYTNPPPPPSHTSLRLLTTNPVGTHHTWPAAPDHQVLPI